MTSDKDRPVTEGEENFAAALGERLRDAEHDLDPQIQARLAQARREAVAVADRKSKASSGYWFGAGGAVAAAALLVVIFTTGQVDPNKQMPNVDPEEFAAAQELEMLEDLEFIAWVASLEEEDEPSQG